MRRRSLLAEFVLSSLEIVLFAGGVLCLASCQHYLLSGGEDKSICVWSPKDDWQCCRLIESDELFRVTVLPGVSKRLLDRRVLENAAGDGQVSSNTGDLRVGLLVAGDASQQGLDGQGSVVDLAMSEPGEEIEELAQAQILKSVRHSALA